MAASAWAASGLYIVGDDQISLVTRLGAYAGEDGPGLRYHLPFPLETPHLVPFGTESRLEVGVSGDGTGPSFATRDGFPLHLGYEVHWRVINPRRFLFGSTQPETTLRLAAQLAIRTAVSQAPAAALLADDGPVAAQARATLQRLLDRYGVGVRVSELKLEGLAPPDVALPGFRDVAAARQDAETVQRDADLYRARALADARGDADKAVSAAQTVRNQEVAEAKGEAARFALVDAQYRKAPDVTRERLYTEMMARVLHGVNKVVVPGGRAVAPITLPPDAFRSRPAATPSQAAPSAGSDR